MTAHLADLLDSLPGIPSARPGLLYIVTAVGYRSGLTAVEAALRGSYIERDVPFRK